MDNATGEIDVVDTQTARLADPQSRERAEQNCNLQVLRHDVVQRPHLLRGCNVGLLRAARR
jgi:hypothetical protein